MCVQLQFKFVSLLKKQMSISPISSSNHTFSVLLNLNEEKLCKEYSLAFHNLNMDKMSHIREQFKIAGIDFWNAYKKHVEAVNHM